MSRLEGGLHGLKSDPSARSDDQDFRHGVMLLVGLAWLIVMCNAGSRTARRAGGTHEGLAGVRPGAHYAAGGGGGGFGGLGGGGFGGFGGSMGQPIQLIRSGAHRPFAERRLMEHSRVLPA